MTFEGGITIKSMLKNLDSFYSVLKAATKWHIENRKYNFLFFAPYELHGLFAILLAAVAVPWLPLQQVSSSEHWLDIQSYFIANLRQNNNKYHFDVV